jgi:hypothetical protein
MQIALDKYYQDYGYYPQSQVVSGKAKVHTFDELFYDASTEFKSSNGRPYMEGYLMGDYVDAWGQPFYYQCPGTMNPEKYDLWSTGQDLKMGNSGESGDLNYSDAQTPNAQDSDDITNWKRH